MDNNTKGSWIKNMLQLCSTKISQKYHMYHITWNIEYRHLYARKGFSRLRINDAYLQDLQFQSGIIVEGSIYGILREKVQWSCAITQNNLWDLAKSSMERILYQDGKAVYCWVTKLRYIAIQSEKLHGNITEDQLNDFLVQESSVRI